MSLAGKKAVVTGGSRGIGAASAIALAKAGADVFITYLSRDTEANAVAATIREMGREAHVAQMDGKDETSVQEFAGKVREVFSQVDVLFTNAGDLVERRHPDAWTASYYRDVFDTNVLSAVLTIVNLRPLLVRGSVVINNASIAARTGGLGGAVMYASSKGALVTMTRGLANEYADAGIRVFSVCPGIVLTDFHDRHTSQETLRQLEARLPCRKLGEPDDIARAVVFLAGEGNGFMTGVNLDINGGGWYP